MWYNMLSWFLAKKGFIKNDDCPYVFIRKSKHDLCIIIVNIDDLNSIEKIEDINEGSPYLKIECKLKELDKTRYCIGLKPNHTVKSIL
jgi:hypothetical protein